MDGERCQVTEGRARGQLLGLWLSATQGGTEREATAAPGQAPSAFLPGRGVSRTGLLPTWRKVLNVSSFSSGTLALVCLRWWLSGRPPLVPRPQPRAGGWSGPDPGPELRGACLHRPRRPHLRPRLLGLGFRPQATVCSPSVRGCLLRGPGGSPVLSLSREAVDGPRGSRQELPAWAPPSMTTQEALPAEGGGEEPSGEQGSLGKSAGSPHKHAANMQPGHSGSPQPTGAGKRRLGFSKGGVLPGE